MGRGDVDGMRTMNKKMEKEKSVVRKRTGKNKNERRLKERRRRKG